MVCLLLPNYMKTAKDPFYIYKRGQFRLYILYIVHKYIYVLRNWALKSSFSNILTNVDEMSLNGQLSLSHSDFVIKEICWENTFLMQNWSWTWEHARQVGKILMMMMASLVSSKNTQSLKINVLHGKSYNLDLKR